MLRKKDPVRCFYGLKFPMIYQFLNWYLGQRTGKGGRSKRLVRSRGSLITFWCCFRLAFQRATAYKIDTIIDRDLMYNVSVHRLCFMSALSLCETCGRHGGSCSFARLIQLQFQPSSWDLVVALMIYKADSCLGHGQTEQTIQVDTQEAAE